MSHFAKVVIGAGVALLPATPAFSLPLQSAEAQSPPPTLTATQLVAVSASSLPWPLQTVEAQSPQPTFQPTFQPTLTATHLAAIAAPPSAPEASPQRLMLVLGIVPNTASLHPFSSKALVSPPPESHQPEFSPSSTLQAQAPAAAEDLNLSPSVIEGSSVLQRWLRQVPDVAEEIANDPSFRTRLRLAYSQFPSNSQGAGVNLAVEDAFIGQTRLTVSADYQTSFTEPYRSWGADLRYYLRPLGNYVNISPIVGYRRLENSFYTVDGVNLGVRLLLVLSRGGGADVALSQTWVAPGDDRTVSLTTLSAGYAMTYNLRAAVEIQQQNSRQRQDSRVGLALEWQL